MKNTEAFKIFKKKLYNEVKLLLRFYASLIRIKDEIHGYLHDKIGRTTYVDLLILLKAAENDIIIRLAKLDDNTKNTVSFQKLLHILPSTNENKTELKDSVMKFSTCFNDLKQQRRNQELAHLNKDSVDNELNINIDLRPHIINLLKIMDVLFDEDLKYPWSDGAYEKYDLKVFFKSTLGTLTYPANNFS